MCNIFSHLKTNLQYFQYTSMIRFASCSLTILNSLYKKIECGTEQNVEIDWERKG